MKQGASKVQGPRSNAEVSRRWTLNVGRWILIFTALASPACNRNYLNENDKLRAEVMELQTQAAQLKERAEAAEKRLEIAERDQPGGAALPEGVHAPATSRIAIVKPSRGCDTDNDGADDAVRVYLATYDQRGRFLPTIAAAQVTVAAVPAGRDAVTVATKEFDAKSFDDSYRAGMGQHYTLVIPLTNPVPPRIDKLTVTVELTDLLTGATHEAQKIVNFSGTEPSGAPD